MSLAAVCPIQECTLARGGQVTERTPKASGRKTATHMLQWHAATQWKYGQPRALNPDLAQQLRLHTRGHLWGCVCVYVCRQDSALVCRAGKMQRLFWDSARGWMVGFRWRLSSVQECRGDLLLCSWPALLFILSLTGQTHFYQTLHLTPFLCVCVYVCVLQIERCFNTAMTESCWPRAHLYLSFYLHCVPPTPTLLRLACTMDNQAIWRDRVPSTPVSGYCYYVYRRASSSRICVRVWSLKKASTMKQASGIRTPRLFFIFFLSFFPSLNLIL